MKLKDRAEAGRLLAARLSSFRGKPDVVVFALPRGGVPVALEVASALGVPLDVLVVRKLGVPGREELAMGAIASGGIRVLDIDVIRSVLLPPWAIEETTEREQHELARRERLYRKGRPLDVFDRTVLIVDDGLATGSSMRTAVAALRRRSAARVVVAVGVAPPSTLEKLAHEADDVVCLAAPDGFDAVGSFYESFPEVTDDEVCDLLARVRPRLVSRALIQLAHGRLRSSAPNLK